MSTARQIHIFVASVLIGVAGLWALLESEEIALEPPFEVQPNLYRFKRDPAHNVLIFYRASWKEASPAVRVYAEGLRQARAFVPLRDLPLLESISISDVAATPDGGCLILGVLHYPGRRIEHAILRYSGSGVLNQLWRMEPYDHHKLAVDRAGHVFAFGHRLDARFPPQGPDYPLLVKYSPDGQVLSEFLPASQFPEGVNIVSSRARFGELLLFVAEDSLFLFVGATGELFRFDLEGQLLERKSLSTALEEIAVQAGSVRAEVISLSLLKESNVVAQLRLWPRDRTTEPFAFQIVQIGPGGFSWKVLSQRTPLPYPGFFLGISNDSKFLFLGQLRTGEVVLGKYERIPQ